ncbi:hypothetical protein RRG08_032127 [Elysia crispata]|uniref:Uncharacterized protein n=1 Tax=Elysia crispata TaxID=231223 RepID=A0AAE0ZDP0_9GAST|nr:hypothetical protein RRG08_032127 [Elysia crispata]
MQVEKSDNLEWQTHRLADREAANQVPRKTKLSEMTGKLYLRAKRSSILTPRDQDLNCRIGPGYGLSTKSNFGGQAKH